MNQTTTNRSRIMFYVYGKEKFEDRYSLVNVNRGEFVNRKLHATLFEKWIDADRACYLLEKENPGFTFETREA